MSSTERISQEEGSKALMRSFIQEIFNELELSTIEKYFGNDSVEGSPRAGKGGEGFVQFF
jgi:predicted SnoaL-like aldol condensation-catalyzing enzyme